jgi:hypothetical protein
MRSTSSIRSSPLAVFSRVTVACLSGCRHSSLVHHCPSSFTIGRFAVFSFARLGQQLRTSASARRRRVLVVIRMSTSLSQCSYVTNERRTAFTWPHHNTRVATAIASRSHQHGLVAASFFLHASHERSADCLPLCLSACCMFPAALSLSRSVPSHHHFSIRRL